MQEDTPELKAAREAIFAALNELQGKYDSRVLYYACLVRAELLARKLIDAGIATPKGITQDFALSCTGAVDGQMPRLGSRSIN